jgi:hypothetical protein
MAPRLLHRDPSIVERPISISLCRLGAHDSLTSRQNGRVLGVAVEKPAVMAICVGGRGVVYCRICRAMTPEQTAAATVVRFLRNSVVVHSWRRLGRVGRISAE